MYQPELHRRQGMNESQPGGTEQILTINVLLGYTEVRDMGRISNTLKAVKEAHLKGGLTASRRRASLTKMKMVNEAEHALLFKDLQRQQQCSQDRKSTRNQQGQQGLKRCQFDAYEEVLL